ncbi:MFS transporter [Streptomyces sp. ME02-8801-2C]|uniref:MFS transporter n=1 Tax=Streptomyces sp. ME02-8801-2C TaxID=3028680 RepID=UPI0029AA5DA3|nr:MFS transporter [Streptomyces sp. ME02-8801-2C]MDX3455602.1 MFS transporter [Streptomyces sp. ME02-8801-2C]
MSYRDVATKQVLIWSCTSVGARMPVAMAPLALVFLVRERPGGYALGAALAAAYVLGEIVGAPALGLRLRPERARPQLAAGLVVGAAGFVALGVFPGAHPGVLAAFAFMAGGAPAASAGGLRALLTDLVPARAVAQAMSAESMLMSGVWAVSPAAVTSLALGLAPRLPLLLAAVLMASSLVGLWLLPADWGTDDARGEGQGRGTGQGRGKGHGKGHEKEGAGPSLLGLLVGAWPVYVTGAASLTLLGLAELVLPALLEQRGIGVGWSGPILAGMAVGAGLGAFVYGLRAWPGRLRTRSVVLIVGMSVCVTGAALIPGMAGIAAALAVSGMLQSGALVTRNLSLREALPPGALAAGYSVMYAAAGAGYAAAGSLAGALLQVTAPSTAVLAGVALTLLLTGVGWWGETRTGDRSAGGADTVVTAGPAGLAGPAAAGASSGASDVSAGDPAGPACLDGPGPEGTAIRGRCDPEHRL